MKAQKLYTCISLTFGGYPELMNFSSLHHLLLLESLLWKRHQWYELFPGTPVCEIEGFHMVINRYRHIRNLQARVFFNRHLANYLDTYDGTYSSNEVNSMIREHGELYHRDMVLDHVWLKRNFYYPRQIDIQVKSLKDLSRIQLTHNMVFKRLDAFVRRVTHPMQLDHPDILENGAYFSQWKKACNIFSQGIMSSKQRNGISPITPHQVSCIMYDSMYYPIEMLLRIMRER